MAMGGGEPRTQFYYTPKGVKGERPPNPAKNAVIAAALVIFGSIVACRIFFG